MIGYEKICSISYSNVPNNVVKNATATNRSGTEAEELDLSKIIIKPGLEDDNPFDNIIYDSDTDTAEIGETENKSPEDNPFDTGDDPFDMNDSDESSDKEKDEPKVMDREQAIKDKYNMSKNIRKKFPSKLLELLDIAKRNVNVLEDAQVETEDEPIRVKLVSRYKVTIKSLEIYLSSLDSEMYEDIFANYAMFWSTFLSMKELADKIMI